MDRFFDQVDDRQIEYHVRGTMPEEDGKLYVAVPANEGDAETSVIAVGDLQSGHITIGPQSGASDPRTPHFYSRIDSNVRTRKSFVRFRGRTIGPFTPDKVKEMVRRGQVTRMHELSGDGLSWMKADEFGNFFPHAQAMGSSSLAAGASTVPPGSGGGGMDDMDGGGAVAPAANQDATAEWYAHVNGEKQGPVSMDQMRLYSEAKILKKDSLVWKNGMDEWKPAAECIPQLFGGAAAAATSSASSSTESSQPVAEGAGAPLIQEMGKNHAFVLTAAICLLVGGLIVVAGEIFALQRPGMRVQAEYYAAAIPMVLAIGMMVSGGFGIAVANKLKPLADSSSQIGALLAVRSINQLWMVGMICLIVWLAALILAAIAAMANGIVLVYLFV